MKKILSVLMTLALLFSFGSSAWAAPEDTGYIDVDADSWYAGAVQYVTEGGLMVGTADQVFAPDQTMTRAMLATTLYRVNGEPETTTDDTFTDTSADDWFAVPVAWAAETGVVHGIGDGLFGPNNTVTREQTATMLWNAAGNPEVTTTTAYADQSAISAYATDAVAWAAENGIMNGRDGNRFAPQAGMTRAETAAVLANMQATLPPEEEPAPEPDQDKSLVVYFSATGNTERVAQMIADETGADIFELEPSDPYTADDLDWTDPSSRVNAEHENEALRDITLIQDTVDNWDDYDTVYIGYPIWWGIAAWPVDGFVEANDFSGKTVIPFATSSSSGMGESGALLADLAGTGDWQEGMRFSGGADAADVQAWLSGLAA